MAYIGHQPAEKYVSLTTQHFTVTATASYVLTNSVTNENEIALFINNVRQEPGGSYAYTAAGTTLTLSAATAGTDTMYCVYLGKAIGTVAPPDGSVNSAKIVDGSITDGDLAGSISSAKITSLDATKLTGTVAEARLATLDATKLTGTIHVDRLANAPATDLSQLEMNQALLAFKIAASNQLAKFQMVDQVIDEYQDATGIDAGASTNELAGGATTAKYYEGGSVSSVTASGGTITTDGDFTLHTFTATGNSTFTTNTAQDIEYLVVAGGGGGGGGSSSSGQGGGGGAGGFRTGTGFGVTATSYTVTVGVGGTAVPVGGTGGTNGGDSVFSTITSTGGGRGSAYNSQSATTGGSGGGGSQGLNAGAAGNTPSTSPVQGYAGGTGDGTGAVACGGGGGGASQVGFNHSHIRSSQGGAGGAGRLAANFTHKGTASDNTGTSGGYFAGGGAGSSYNANIPGAVQALGGAGGGGNGIVGTTNSVNPTAGADNTGGGGGAGGSGTVARNGGSGIVIIRRPTTATSSGGNLTLQSVATTAESAPTTGDLVVLVDDGGSGTSAVQTNIKGFISRNGNFATLDTDHKQVTFVDEGTWGTTKQKILVARNVDLSGITTGTSMKYRLTTHSQSAGTMETRIHATSLAWA